MKHAGKLFGIIAILALVVCLAMACDDSSGSSSSPSVFTVKFVTNGGGTIADQTVTSGDKVTKPSVEKSGYTLDGWYTTSTFAAGSKWAFETDTVSKNITLYAKWALDVPEGSYLVTFVSNGGSAVDEQLVEDGELVEPVTASKSGYTLDGWYTTSTFESGSKWNFATGTVTDDITLYAKWNVITGDDPGDDPGDEPGDESGTVTITYYLESEHDIVTADVTSTTLSKGDLDALAIIADSEDYTGQRWFVNGVEDTDSAGEVSYNFSSYGKEVDKQYTVVLMVEYEGRYYSTNFTVTVIE